jgi:hypothetical protein
LEKGLLAKSSAPAERNEQKPAAAGFFSSTGSSSLYHRRKFSMDVITAPTNITIKFDELAQQTAGGITRISGFVRARHFIQIIDSLDLEANPRSSKIGRVTNAIIDSIETTPAEFPFKTKGVLLGATKFEILDRGRVRAVFQERDKEGILDGGHNTLAIGLHILNLAGVAGTKIRKARDWATFRELWAASESEVKGFRGNLSAFGSQEPTDDELSFLIPVELIVPSDLDDVVIVDQFQSSILEICAARNNNAELVVSAKSNQAGFYEPLKQMLPADISKRIEWKVGEGGVVKVADLIAMTWIPLSLLDPMPTDDGEKPVVAPIAQNLYRNKGECLLKFDDLMRLDAVTTESNGKADLRNARVQSALRVAADMPAVFDLIEKLFPDAYNKAQGAYGRIGAVKKLNPENHKQKHSKFAGLQINTASPDGFLYPVVYGVRELMEQREDGTIAWATDPIAFIEQNIVKIAEQYKAVMQALNWEPQPIGKAPLAYQVVSNAYSNLLAASGK